MDNAHEAGAAAIADQLMMAAQLLSTLESGRVRMHAHGYWAVAEQASMTLRELGRDALVWVRDRGPKAVRELAEAELNARGDAAWATPEPSRDVAAAQCEALLRRLAKAHR